MLQNEILQYIQEKKNLGFMALFKKFNVTTSQEKKQIKSILKELREQGLIKVFEKTGRISLNRDNEKSSSSRSSSTHTKSSSPSTQSKERNNISFTNDPTEDYTLVREKYDLPASFITAIQKEIDNEIWNNNSTLEKYREDLRDKFIITIDGADSKDLDDAVSVTKKFFGDWELGVHIADVSYYVPQFSALDTEALNRSNSYYLINKVIPMLPKTLSNDLCSLNPHEEKKSMSIFITIDNNGNFKKFRIVPSVIKTSYRMTYDRVEEIIKGDKDIDSTLVKNIKLMHKLFKILNNKRTKAGSVDFSFKEKKIILDDNDNPTKIYQKDRQDSERLIEEFMLAANQVAGQYLTEKGLGLFRVHDVPPAEKYQKLKNFAAKRGHRLPDMPTPKDLQAFINTLHGSDLQVSGEIMTLRSMAQAVYQRDNIGHFGLGFDLYAHFTSPIRRYADLVVHRLIKYFLYQDAYKQAPYNANDLDRIANHISAQERIAMEAERELAKIKSVRYMKASEGKTIEGVISSVASFGIFIEEPMSGVEAMIRFVDMPEYIVFDEEELIAYNRSKSKIYQIGKPITIRITNVNVTRGFIDAEEVFYNN